MRFMMCSHTHINKPKTQKKRVREGKNDYFFILMSFTRKSPHRSERIPDSLYLHDSRYRTSDILTTNHLTETIENGFWMLEMELWIFTQAHIENGSARVFAT